MKNARELVKTYGDMIYRICLVSLKNHADAEDAVQEVFLKYFTHAPDFSGDEHEKAWLIRVAVNHCKNMLRARKAVPTDPGSLHPPDNTSEQNAVLDALMDLPEKFRTVMTLRYVFGYKIREISEMLGKPPSTIKTRISKGKKLLSDIYRKEYLS